MVLSTGLAASMLLAVPAPAQAVLSEAQRAEQEATILKQKEQLEFALQLQENARKAALVGRCVRHSSEATTGHHTTPPTTMCACRRTQCKL